MIDRVIISYYYYPINNLILFGYLVTQLILVIVILRLNCVSTGLNYLT